MIEREFALVLSHFTSVCQYRNSPWLNGILYWAATDVRYAFVGSAEGSQECDPDDHACATAREYRIIGCTGGALLAEDDPFAAILSLDAFERFVFVMSIVEGQSDEECAILLRCSRRDVMMARVLALKHQSIADALGGEILQS